MRLRQRPMADVLARSTFDAEFSSHPVLVLLVIYSTQHVIRLTHRPSYRTAANSHVRPPWILTFVPPS
ncbi:MAG: hypothetical protein ABW034_10745, partial [Steroidobacteraceae bacterium]